MVGMMDNRYKRILSEISREDFKNKEDTIKGLIKDKLDSAEELWRNNGSKLGVINESMESISESYTSSIPGYEVMEPNSDEVCDFVALVVDMRGSSEHLTEEPKNLGAKVSHLQRVYYETAALLPALALSISFEKGAVTEYLGDGVLALFKVDGDQKNNAIERAFKVAKYCLKTTLSLVNAELAKRYNLPPLSMGIGLSYSPALVTLVGVSDSLHPKAFGECVFKATKLSCGVNEICADSRVASTLQKIEVDRFDVKVVNGIAAFVLR